MALGMSAFPSFMTQATPATQPLINAEPAVAAQAEQNPQVGQVMPGVQGADAPVVAQNGPSRDVKLTFAQIAPPPGSMVLRGINPNGSIEFGMRSDEVVTKAMLNLEYTPSPSLLPVQSQLKVYLNDELMGVLPVTKEQLGKKTLAQMPINPLFITDFNRVRLEFVGHYQDVCENPASTTLWLDVGRSSGLDLTYQTLNVKNDLSHFPVPFFDPRDNRTNTLPMVFRVRRMLSCNKHLPLSPRGLVRVLAGVGRTSRCSITNCRIAMPLSLPPMTNARTSCAIIRR